MRAWIKEHAGLSIGIGIAFTLLLVCSGTAFVWSNYPRINKTLWELTKPEKYYINIWYEHTYQRCLWISESVWQDDKLIDIVSISDSDDELCTEVQLHVEDWSMDYIFNEIVGKCGKGTVACAIQYDPRFHYPAEVTSLYQYHFKAKVITCDIDKPNCP